MQRKKGFSLIELMIIIAIIAILAAILMPNFLRAQAQAKLSACEINLKNIATSIEMYATDNIGKYPSAIRNNPAFNGIYTKNIPFCSTGATYGYNAATDYDSYSIFCSSTGRSNHYLLDIPSNYPVYDSIRGLIVKE